MAAEALENGVDTIAQLERTPAGVVKRWIAELDIAQRAMKDWVKDGEDAWKVYKSQKSEVNFNILWSNTETLRPALYNSEPEPDVRRRNRDKDPKGRYASLVLKRALKYELEAYDFDKHIQDTVLDVLVPGRGIARIKYKPTFQKMDVELDPLGNEPAPEQIYDEASSCEHVQWDKFRHGPGKTWDEVPWVAFEHTMPKDQLVEFFGEELANKIPLNESQDYGKTSDKTMQSLVKTACVWEIWDKQKLNVLFICEQYKKTPLLETDDPLHLGGFFPNPRPIYAIEDSTSLVPQPLYEKYKTQAEELNRVSRRITKIVDALKVRGAYAANLSELATVIEASDNQMIPIANASEVAAMGGLDKAIWVLPIDKLAGVLDDLYTAREKTMQTIYEITGLGDIMRGVSNPHETLGAQQLKSQWGTLRLQRMQREVQRFIRDIVRLKGEVIAEHFQQQTLQEMTGVELPSAQDKMKLQMQIQQAQQTGGQVPEEMQAAAEHVMSMPTWEEIMQLLRSDQMRRFQIDIETDSTIQETLTRDSQAMQEAITAVVNLFNGLAPAIQMGAMSVEVAKTIALSMARNAKMGEAVEEAIEQIRQPPPQPPEQAPPDHTLEVAQLKAQSDEKLTTIREQNAAQMQDKELQTTAQLEQAKLQVDASKVEVEKIKTQTEAAIRRMELEAEREMAEMAETVKVALAKMSAGQKAEEADADRQHESQEKAADRQHTSQESSADRAAAAQKDDKTVGAKKHSDMVKVGTTVAGLESKAESEGAQRKHEKETAAAETDAEGGGESADMATVLKAIHKLIEAQSKPKHLKFELDKKGNVIGATQSASEGSAK